MREHRDGARDERDLGAKLQAAPELGGTGEARHLDLHPEDLVIRVDGLVADLDGELHREVRAFDLHRHAGDVGGLAERERLRLEASADCCCFVRPSMACDSAEPKPDAPDTEPGSVPVAVSPATLSIRNSALCAIAWMTGSGITGGDRGLSGTSAWRR